MSGHHRNATNPARKTTQQERDCSLRAVFVFALRRNCAASARRAKWDGSEECPSAPRAEAPLAKVKRERRAAAPVGMLPSPPSGGWRSPAERRTASARASQVRRIRGPRREPARAPETRVGRY